MSRLRTDSGAAAVEFALVILLLVPLLIGIIEFGRAYNVQLSLSAAAREGVRVMAIGDDPAAATQATIDAAPSLNPALTAGDITVSPAACTGGDATVAINYNLTFLTGLIPGTISLEGNGVMRCGG